MPNQYDIGDLVRCTGTFTDTNSAAQDPDGVYFVVKDPSGNTSSYTYGVDDDVAQSDTGIYYVDVPVDESGQWWYRWYSTGSGQAAGEEYFMVRKQQVE